MSFDFDLSKIKWDVKGKNALTVWGPTELQQAAFICTNCGKAFGGMGLAPIMEKFVYCPYCGIKLEGEEPDEEEE